MKSFFIKWCVACWIINFVITIIITIKGYRWAFVPIKKNTGEFIVCPGCEGESNKDVDMTCGICGCAGIVAL